MAFSSETRVPIMPDHPQAHILIIDDTPLNIEILLGILEGDYALSFATSGAKALKLLAKGIKPDLILLDVMMPDMDGFAVCAALKADPATRDIPVIFVTAKTDALSEIRALKAGGVDFIHKPVNQALVRARVQLHLELERRARALAHSLAETQRLHDELLVLNQAMEQSPTSIIITDATGNIHYVNPYFSLLTGYSADEVQGRNPRFLKSGLTSPEIYVDLWAHLSQGEPWKGELINRRKNGEVYWEEAYIGPVWDAAGRISHFVAVKLNVTDRILTRERLIHMASHDVLTDLPNRGLFAERLQQALELAMRNATKLALLFIDLDQFKPINDTWGHRVGDLLLRAVAESMKQRLRAADTIGRLGGDEFVVLLTDLAGPDGALRVAEELRQALAQPFVIEGHALSISASIGIALYPDHGANAEDLTRHADAAMYRAKQGGRNRLDLFTPAP
ncbi:MAG: diguanylate cyclase [Gammaproteobacteria bacterium]|jgi:diguanylate cyclase (GGDEF)-like protein/PAS domain S-box-containing protein|nr:diguanylate cyclase [Gammaproteobacteria bacterium]